MNALKMKLGITTFCIFGLLLQMISVFGPSVLIMDTMKGLWSGGNDKCTIQKLTVEEMRTLRGGTIDACIQYDYCWDPRCQPITIIPPKYVLCDDEQQPFWCKQGRTDDDWCILASVTCRTTNRPIYDNAGCSGDPISNNGKCEKTQSGTKGTIC